MLYLKDKCHILWFICCIHLRFLPLRPTGLTDLKVDPLDALRTSHDLNPAQVRLEVVEDTFCQLQERLQPGVMRHVLRQVGQQNGHIEANVLWSHRRMFILNKTLLSRIFPIMQSFLGKYEMLLRNLLIANEEYLCS